MSWAAAATIFAAYLQSQQAEKNRQAQASANRANIQGAAVSELESTRRWETERKDEYERAREAQGELDVIGRQVWQESEYQDVSAGEREQSRREREAGINLQRRQRLDPFYQAGTRATAEQEALLGLRGEEAGTAAMGRFKESPGQRFIRERAQKSLLRGASAIGGLGGGNVRSALVEQGAGFAAQDYDRQFQRLGGLSGRGLAAAQDKYVMTGTDVGISTTRRDPYQGRGKFREYTDPMGKGFDEQSGDSKYQTAYDSWKKKKDEWQAVPWNNEWDAEYKDYDKNNPPPVRGDY